jgi:hypothetical protein
MRHVADSISNPRGAITTKALAGELGREISEGVGEAAHDKPEAETTDASHETGGHAGSGDTITPVSGVAPAGIAAGVRGKRTTVSGDVEGQDNDDDDHSLDQFN